MYSQGLIGSGEQTTETPEFLAAFQARIMRMRKLNQMILCQRRIARP